MGQRSRRRGITNAALRAARAAAQQTDDRCAAIAQHTYAVAREIKAEGGEQAMPLEVMAPVTAAAEQAAGGAAKMAGLDHTDEAVVGDVAAYLVYGFREMAVFLDRAHFEAWRRDTDAAAQERRPNGGGGPDGQAAAADGGAGGGEPDPQPPGGAEGGATDAEPPPG